jgi:hypothetical protein
MADAVLRLGLEDGRGLPILPTDIVSRNALRVTAKFRACSW